MGTSLTDQLRKLAVPQTSLLVQDKKRPSLLFDPKEAANLDRETFYELGLSGFNELKILHHLFAEFEHTLFNLSSISLERSVETKDSNSKLNRHIRKFLLLLSPYFLLKPSHKALEWLINRFHIHEYNVDDLMMLILPYHETRIFIRVLQLLDVKDPSSRWHWLYPLQKPGVVLGKGVLLKHCSRDVAMLKFVSEMTLAAIKVYKAEGAGALSTLFAFYCMTLVGALERSKTVTELQLTHIITSLLRGLKSPVAEFCAAALMITAQIARKTQLSKELLFNIITRIIKSPDAVLSVERVTLLVLFYQNQDQLGRSLPDGAALEISHRPWFPAALGEVGRKGAHIALLLSALLADSLNLIQAETSDMKHLQSFTYDLLVNVTVDSAGAKQIIQCVVQSFGSPLDSGLQAWCSELMGQLERQYATAFDAVVKTTDRDLTLLLPSHLQVVNQLHHHDSRMRVLALRRLAKSYAGLDCKEKDLLAESLTARFADDSPDVVKTFLGFRKSDLIDIMGEDNLNERLITLLNKCWLVRQEWEWQDVARDAVAHLCFSESKPMSTLDVRLLIAVFPFLLPDQGRMEFAKMVLDSDLKKSNTLIAGIGKVLRSNAQFSNEGTMCEAVIQNVEAELFPCPHEIKKVIDAAPKDDRTPIFVFSACSLLAYSLPKNTAPEDSNLLIESVFQSVRDSNLVMAEGFTTHTYMKIILSGFLPVECYLHWITVFIDRTNINTVVLESPWWDLSNVSDQPQMHSVLFLLKVFEVIVKGCTGPEKLRNPYVDSLGSFFRRFFPTLPSQVVFLCKASIEASAAMRVRCLRLSAALMQGSPSSMLWALSRFQRTVVPTLIVAAHDALHAVRVSALAVLECLLAPNTSLEGRLAANSYLQLVERLVERKEELCIDADQIGLALYTALSPDPTVQSVLNRSHQRNMSISLDSLLSCVLDRDIPGPLCAGLLSALRLVTSPEILVRLVPLARRLLESGAASGSLDAHHSASLRHILARLTGESLRRPKCWSLLETALGDDMTRLERPGPGTPPPPALPALELVTQEFFAAADETVQQRLLAAMVAAGTDTEQTAVVSAMGRAFKRLSLEARLAVHLLEEMRDAKNPDPPGGKGRRLHRFVNVAPTVALLQTPAWRRGTTLLELLQGKKKLHSVQALLPCLFGLLKKCLQFEEQAPVEYTKQLLLSLLLHCCQKLSDEGPLPPGVALDAELVIECVRATQNPQTHHHVLLLLSHVARLSPHTVLHNIMAVFTFMGSSVLRQDDAYSFQVITQIVDTIIPTLVQSAEWCEVSSAVCGVLRVFVDALLDIPEHRQLPLFHKLLTTLNAENSLWILLCLVVESHVMHGGTEAGSKLSRRLEFALNLAQGFPPKVVFESCVRVLEYIQSLPSDKDESSSIRKKTTTKTSQVAICGVTGLFDVERNSAKQLRHLKYALSMFLASILASPLFVSQVVQLSEGDTLLLEKNYRALIENLLVYIGSVTREVDGSQGKLTAKYWRVMLNQGYDILDKVNSLLPSELFLAVTCSLLTHNLLPVQRKALELFNSRLQHQSEIFTSCDRNSLFNVMKMLISIIKTIHQAEDKKGVPSEGELIQQTALLSVKLMARLLGAEEPHRFKKVLSLVTMLAGSKLQSGPLLASVLLCLAELCGTLRVHAIPSLASLVPPLLAALETHTGSADIMILSTVTAIDKVVEALPFFLSPYLDNLLFHIVIQSASWQDQGDNTRVAPIVIKLKAIMQKMACSIPSRVLIPAVGRCYSKLLACKEYAAIGPLLGVLSDSFRTFSAPELGQLQSELMSVLLRALDARFEVASAGLEVVMEVEGHAVKALVAFVLKLSESAFRPLYYSLFHWATEPSAHADRVITFYRLSSTIAESLKGLFVLFAGHFLKNAAMLLDKTNTTKNDSPMFPCKSHADSDQKAILLLRYILETLHCVFLYDSGTFVTKERFESVMQPIVDQLENTLGGSEALDERVKTLLTPCIAQMAAASADDIMWKHLNYQVLLKARHNLPQVRLAGLATLCAVASKLGEDFLPLLPETIPFLAELMEDEEETVEQAAQKALQDLESVLGEPLQKYF